MALVYKMLEEGNGIEVDEEGHPLVFDDEKDESDQKPFSLRATELYTKIPALQAEAKKYREGFKDLEPDDVHEKLADYEKVSTKLKEYEGIDAEKAREAITTVANLGELDKEKTIEIEKIKKNVDESWRQKTEDMKKGYEIKISSLQKDIESKDTSINDLLVRGAFYGSKYIQNETVLPADIAYAKFGKHFKVEKGNDGELRAVAYDNNGDRILGLIDPVNPAPPEEAIEKLINQYSEKDSILRTSAAGGSGAGGNNQDPSKRASRKERENMNPSARLTDIWSNGSK